MKLAIIGNWGHHVHVLQETDEMKDLEVVAIAPGFEGEDLSTMTSQYSKARVYDDHLKMLEQEKPDVVTISTRLDRITQLAIDASKANCHSICEKPLALEHNDLLQLWETIIKNRTQCIAMLPNRNHPVLAFAKQQIEAGRIGDVSLLNARKSYKFGHSRDEWLCKRSSYGGTIPWIGIHALDFINSVSDSPCSSLSAMHANLAHPQFPEIEDSCTLSIKFKNGTLATASVDYLRPLSADGHGDDWIRIVGTSGIIEASMDRGECTIIDSSGHSKITSFDDKSPYYPPLMRTFPKSGTGEITAETRRSFHLSHLGLSARDAADTEEKMIIDKAPWDKT
ncbi:Gfo/Idh/MocA family oxidoreductase [Lentisphaera profundi]|uniref:Gfo/Idh/MocA family oxidoreductase n=1 Tax=Lentisphaera profundi TaxID=1658616 RepID=A0ABY7VSV7_9BACT|nr:Gfo/Idh/MocA family oxidoreductase [Lentisphaera profundi]WDE97275.1 Gfo/Idh/MocA family oxidoreductase [Lentisphaera profundi]